MIDADPSEPDALAYHTETNDQVEGYVLCKTILDYGGVVLFKDAETPTVASALFHELAEAVCDPCCNSWWQADDGALWCAEVCDPVQGGIVPVSVVDANRHTVKVGLSDFIYPTWRDPEATTGPFNYLKTLRQPFTIDAGGYAVKIDSAGQPQQVFGAKVPKWVKDMKSKGMRVTTRKSKNRLHHRKVHGGHQRLHVTNFH